MVDKSPAAFRSRIETTRRNVVAMGGATGPAILAGLARVTTAKADTIQQINGIR